MTQADILECVGREPGILQIDLPTLTGLNERTIQGNVKRLLKWERIYRKRVRLADRRGYTYALFVV